MKIVLGAILSACVHLLLGWQWCIAVAAIVGWWSLRRGWLNGAAAVGLAWLAIVVFNYSTAGPAVGRMTDTMASFVPHLPSWSVPVLTVAIGTVLGAIGGFLGQAASPYLSRSRH